MTKDPRDLAQSILMRAPWLLGHGVDLVGPLLALGSVRRLSTRHWLHGEGDDGGGVVVVLTGTLHALCQAPGGRETLVSQLRAGAAIGQTARFGGGPRLVTLLCAEESQVFQATDRVLGLIATERPEIWQALSALLYVQTRELLLTLVEVAGLPSRQKLAARLVRLAGSQPEPVTLAISQQELGEMLGLTRKTVNAYLAAFEHSGLIQRAYGALTLLNVSGLRRVAAS